MSSAFDSPLNDTDLALARAGDARGQEAIYRGFSRAVFTLARRMTHCPDAAADIMQNTFLRAFRCLPQYRGDAPFGRWLRSIAATESLMHLRAGRKVLSLFAPDDLAAEDTPAIDDLCQLDLEKALSLMPSIPRSVLWLYHVEGYTHAEIAQMCGKTPSFSKSQLSRAHQRLRELLQNDVRQGTGGVMSNVSERLRELPEFDPPSDGWARLEQALRPTRRRRPRVPYWASGAALAASLLLSMGVWHEAPRSREAAPPAGEVRSLMAESRTLEQRLDQLRPQVVVWDAALAAGSARLEQDLALVDLQLNYASTGDTRQQLWRNRVALMSRLVQLHERAELQPAPTERLPLEWTL